MASKSLSVYCVLCKLEQPGELGSYLQARCSGCGATKVLRPVKHVTQVGMGPIVGPSRVPYTAPPISQQRSPHDEPLEVTRARVAVKRRELDAGRSSVEARAAAELEVPIERWPKRESKPARRRGRATRPPGPVAGIPEQ